MCTRKKKLSDACSRYVAIRIDRIMASIEDLERALKLETKCSAGDKYETGRAMLHLEFEKLSLQLEQYKRLERTIGVLNPASKHQAVSFGSVVRTSRGNYFIAIPAGEIQIEGDLFFAVGAGSPIAQSILGKKVGETFLFKGKLNEITELS